MARPARFCFCGKKATRFGCCDTHGKRLQRHGRTDLVKRRRSLDEIKVLHEHDCIGIPLTRGLVAWVDAESYPLVAPHIWRAVRKGHNWYAVTDIEGKVTPMHHLILPPRDGLDIDHSSGDTLWNMRWNLRAVTHSENLANSRRCHGTAKCLRERFEDEELREALRIAEWEQRSSSN